MKNKIIVIAAILLIIFSLSSAVVFALKRAKGATFGRLNGATSVSPASRAPSTAEEIEKLKQELAELKNQPPQIIYKTVLTPPNNAPQTDNFKTQTELNQAKEQISSLENQLKQLQAQQSQQAVSAPSEADLIASWQVENKVVRIACQDKFLQTWQFGSGVLISADGQILTNEHVVKSSTGLLPDYCLALFSRDFDAQTQKYAKQYKAGIVGFFQDRDATLLKVQDILVVEGIAVRILPITEPFAYFSSSKNRPQIGQSIYVIGFPESARFAFSVTKGIISNLPASDVYFGTDAQIDRGNSGGAAINAAGELIGLPTWKFANGGDYRGYILDINSINL